jgi:tetratricopeptide (TPR) repeat protein
VTTLVFLFLLQGSAGVTQSACGDAELTALLRAREHLARGDQDAALASLDRARPGCSLRRLAALAVAGWRQARALAPAGGAVDLQGPVRQTLQDIQALAADVTATVEVEYASTCIRAAIAAAQDERPEMELLLTHARDLAERLRLRDRRAVWPLSFNLVAGELWFEVDRYAEAVDAYERAVRADPSPVALVGLSRALARLDRVDEACAAYRRVTDAAPPLRAIAARDLAPCQ